MKTYSELLRDSKSLGLFVVETNSLPNHVQGLFFPTPKMIAIRASMSETEKRWTLAHELGHYFDSDNIKLVANMIGKGLVPSRLEDQANSFALNLLTSPEERMLAYRESEGCPKRMCFLLELPYCVGTECFLGKKPGVDF